MRRCADTLAGEAWFERMLLAHSAHEKMKQLCNESEWKPECSFEQAYFHRTFGLYVKPKNEEQLQILRTKLFECGCGFSERDFKFHVTFAYAYKPISNESPDFNSLTKDTKKIEAKIKSVFESNSSIELEKPALCYFRDMTEFIPI
jgi:hypothetical protein